MASRIVLLLALSLSATTFAAADKEAVRKAVGDIELTGNWIYDDIEAGYREAGKSGKPLLVVLRCVP